jgi:hypothetical protein
MNPIQQAYYSHSHSILKENVQVIFLTYFYFSTLQSTKNLGLVYGKWQFFSFIYFDPISSLLALVNHSVHLLAISVWVFTLLFYLMVYFQKFSYPHFLDIF